MSSDLLPSAWDDNEDEQLIVQEDPVLSQDDLLPSAWDDNEVSEPVVQEEPSVEEQPVVSPVVSEVETLLPTDTMTEEEVMGEVEGQNFFPENFEELTGFDPDAETKFLDYIISEFETEETKKATEYWNNTPRLQEQMTLEDYKNSKALDKRISLKFREEYINEFLNKENLDYGGPVGANLDEEVVDRVTQQLSSADEQFLKRQELLKSRGFNTEEEFAMHVRATGTPEQIKKYEDIPKTADDFFQESDNLEYENLKGRFEQLHKNLTSDNAQTRLATQALLDTELSLGAINYIIGADTIFNPATIAVGVGNDIEFGRRAWSEGRKLDAAGNYAMALFGAVEVAGGVGKLAKGTQKVFTRPVSNVTGRPITDRTRFARDKQEKIRTEKEASVHAKANLAINDGIGKKLIEQFEKRNNVIISTKETLKNGKTRLVIDKSKVSEAGMESAFRIRNKELSIVGVDETGELVDASKGQRFDIDLGEEGITKPIVTASSMEGLVGLLSDFNKLYPEQIGKRETLIDDMLHLVLSKDLKPDKIMDMLDANNLKFGEFILATYGSASEAGRILQKFSTINKQKPKSIVTDLDSKIAINREKGFKDFWKRWILRPESIRRGLLVAPVAVAARNLQSAIVRNPIEGLSNLLSNVMLETQRGGAKQGLKSIINIRASNAALRGSMDGMKNLMRDPVQANDFSRYILSEYPEMHKMMYENLHELQQGLGRGQATGIIGKNLDEMLSMAEDLSNVINTPNRIQEHAIRNATFFAELNRLVKREWGIDNFQDRLEAGELADFMNDTSKVRPKDGRSFNNLLADSVDKALKVTYSGQPENLILRRTAELITKSGIGTVFIPFPRFIASGIEFFGELASGAAGPLGRKLRNAFGKGVKGPMTPKEFDKIAKMMVGWGLFGAYTAYHSSDNPDRPENFEQLPVPFNDKNMNIVGTYPLAQANWIGRAVNEIKDGTMESWDGADKFFELFLGGAGLRAGAGNIVVEELQSLGASIDGGDKLSKEKRREAIAKVFGQWMTSWGAPLFQMIDLDRGLGIRTTDRKEVAPEFTLDNELSQVQIQARRSAEQRGGLMTAEEEAALPDRQTVTGSEEKRTGGLLKLFGGIDLKDRNDDIEYLYSIGYDDPNFALGSRHKIRSVRNEQNEMMSKYLPTVIRQAKRDAERAEIRWNKSIGLQKKNSLKQYLRTVQKDSVNENLKSYLDLIRTATEKKALLRNPLAYSTYQYSKLPEQRRRKAELLFAENYPTVELDLGNRKHIDVLIALGKIK